MSLVVLDIESIENKIVKEFIKMDKLWDIPFFLPKSSKLHLSQLGIRSIFIESIGTVATKKLEKNIEKTESSRNRIFLQKVMKNVKFCQKSWKQRLQTWMTTHAQKFRI